MLEIASPQKKKRSIQIRGLQDSNIAMTKGCVEMDLVSLHDPKVKLPVKAYVLEKLTAPLPTERINETHFSHLKNACLADPNFFIPNDIDMILGSDYFFSILLPGQITCAQSNLIAQNSIFGFLVSGKLTESLHSNSMLNLHINGTSIDNQLKQFGKLEEIPNLKDKILTSEEQFVEKHFQNTSTFKSDSIFKLTSNDVIHDLFELYSSLSKIIRILAYCQRFIKNCKKIKSSQGSSIGSSHNNTNPLTFSETKTAEETIIRWVQGIFFQEEIQNIKKQISLPPKSPLRSLHPFIDEHGLVRVGGRLQNSQLRFNSKHPIILPSLSTLLVNFLSRNNTSFIYMPGLRC
ncbi:DUF1758 domain-containing protein [Trichonephila clavata]|uniref:DUF1758 domain-containing protein n=1 Tax=Trichonephila clavata TaxID=2740835 RepID=A0A8X6FQV3_TRICU|nr:DUF1758 domain-containing protein [Trichonephila clavata]